VFSSLTSLAQEGALTKAQQEDLDTLTVWLQGRFSSEQHAQHDTAYSSYRMDVKRIWDDRTDGVWFASEVSPSSDTTDIVYGFIHVVPLPEGMFELSFIKSPVAAAARKSDEPRTGINEVNPDKLRREVGCEIYMQFSGNDFFGSTHGFACRTLPEASYTTTTVEIRSYGMMIWERGYSSSDELVAGPAKGGYVFQKQ